MTTEPVYVLAKDGRRRNIGAILDRNRMRFENWTGRKVGKRWTVLAFSGKDRRGQTLWRCRCTCGNERIISRNNLASGRTQSCGCLRREIMAAKMQAAHALISEAMKATNLHAASER